MALAAKTNGSSHKAEWPFQLCKLSLTAKYAIEKLIAEHFQIFEPQKQPKDIILLF